MKTSVSRRSVLIGLGGGLAATSIVWSLGGLDFRSQRPRIAAVQPVNSGYVDHEGWWLTLEDKTHLQASTLVRHLDNTNLPGSDIDHRVVADVQACASWCGAEPTCRSFTFAKPDSGRPNMCWIKDAVPEPVPDEAYISGILE